MRIEAKILMNWLKKATVGYKIDETRLNFGKLGVEMVESNKAQHLLSKCLLKKQAFKTYEEIGEIALNDTKRFGEFLKRFTGEIDLNKENVTLKLKGKTRNAEYILASIDSMPEKKPFPKYDEWKVSIQLDSKVLVDTITNATTVGKETDIEFNTEDKKLIITTGKDDKFNDIIEDPSIEKGNYTKFGEPLKEVCVILEDNINLSLGNRGPAKIIEKKELEEYIYFIAPKVEDEEDEETEEKIEESA